jgi:hypothetical protein
VGEIHMLSTDRRVLLNARALGIADALPAEAG